MKKLALSLLVAVSCMGLSSCTVTKTFEKEYTFDVTVPVAANGAGSVESIVTQDVDMDQVVREATDKASFSDVEWVHIKEACIELADADNDNNTANFSRAVVDISKPDGSAKVSGSADVPNDYGTNVNLDNAFGEQDLKPTLESDRIQYRVQFDARRATTKELHGKLKVKFAFKATFGV